MSRDEVVGFVNPDGSGAGNWAESPAVLDTIHDHIDGRHFPCRPVDVTDCPVCDFLDSRRAQNQVVQ